MARKARIKSEFGIYYIHQYSHESQSMFRSNEDRQKFIALLTQINQQFQVEVLAYCLASDEAYHLIIELSGSDLSKVMKSLNIGYAIYRNACGHLYKDRYKSLPLNNEAEIEAQIAQLKLLGASYPSRQHFCESYASRKICHDCIRTSIDANAWLEAKCEAEHLTLTQLLKDKEKRNAWVIALRKESTLSLKEIGQVFGGLGESSVCRIIKECR